MIRALLARYPALAYPRFRRYWFASFASVGATQLITLGQGWLVFELSGSPLQLGWLGAAAALPNILMTLIGGVIADRFNQRLIMMFTSGTIALLLALQTWLSATDQAQVWHVLAIAAGISLTTGLDWPARAALYPQFVERNAFLSAVALNAFIWQSTRMALPALGGIMIGYWDTWTVFAAATVGFLIMLAVMTTLKVAPTAIATQSPWQQLTTGVHFIWHTHLFRWLLTLTFVGMFFANAYVQLMPVFADQLEAGEEGYGYLLSAGGVGSVLGTLLIGAINRYQRLGVLMLSAAAASIGALMAFAWFVDHGVWLATLFLVFLTALFASIFQIISMTVLQLRVPDELRGRVMGIHTIGYSLIPLGGLFLGALAEQWDAGSAVVTGSGIYLAILVCLTLTQRGLRALDGTRLDPAPS
ncbi:MAG: MFS transporter [Pseudomonadales bacterium]|jgi:MFS family permease|nr:MFS transporter [Pseudomonadales bacterium]MDP6471460.1 MFS transporter [Pseudomonadales bacterium]MDP6828629.1 MFS transporter [Pseudomonadales bacterium]MDP6972348.1 MFS transporter [Pseudomonadales bacterium]|tara:strand:- start:1042 stop:2286 length:1245 start_codon:yes stop_codon:yes gene_type:complete